MMVNYKSQVKGVGLGMGKNMRELQRDPNAPIITGAAASAGPELEGPAAAGADSEELPDALPQLKNNDFEKKLETMRRVAQSNPRAVAAVSQPQWRPITSSTKARECDSAVE